MPPAPLAPLPAVTLTRPPRPPTAEPDPTSNDPLLPELDVPELNTSMPLDPAVPAFALRITMLPLLVAAERRAEAEMLSSVSRRDRSDSVHAAASSMQMSR